MTSQKDNRSRNQCQQTFRADYTFLVLQARLLAAFRSLKRLYYMHVCILVLKQSILRSHGSQQK